MPDEYSGSTGAIQSQIPWIAQLLLSSGDLTTLSNIDTATNKLILQVSAYNTYLMAEWGFTASSDLLDIVSQNNITIGSPIKFTFFPAMSNDSVELTLCVLSIQSGAGLSATTLGNQFSLTLISPWYFQQYLDSHTYYGNIPSIVSQIFTNDNLYGSSALSDLRIGGTNISALGNRVSSSSADPPANRYRTMMKQGDFIDIRLRKYYRGIGNSSSFMFTNIDNVFDICCFSDMAGLDTYIAIDYSDPQFSAYADWMADPNLIKLMIFPNSNILKINKGNKQNLWDVLSPALAYFGRQKTYIKSYYDTPMLPILGYDKANSFSYVNKNKGMGAITKLYIDDTMHDFDDIQSMKFNEYNKDLRDAHKFTLICMPNLFVKAGRLCNLNLLTKDQTSSSLFTQKDYIISEVTHVFQGIVCRTELTLETSCLSYTDPDTVSLLFTAPTD
jgi:hypothetical protein